ncbi:MAG: DUF1232 domain-containing protein [Clostridia bacterium]|nr:DUF1232 domain-containing protein [Clostridia bacterium]
MAKLNQRLNTNTTEGATQQRKTAKKHSGWIMAVLTIILFVWMLSPIDPIPDMIVGAGQADDLAALCGYIATMLCTLVQHFSSKHNNFENSVNEDELNECLN